ncbi:FAD-dependent oxidoreductase [Enterococcus casseliflavus]|jgi:NADPH-dependent 2,4-dienoyl-CoA reductase/sulfur reductase-like enzyme/rhodanese-related sulfurtransferase|uniref:FAD-dependent oxidoreductase n=1 Tax=Clostridium sp. TaxID=1506 RepID=UPI001883A700|nr:FAD-dependent oxidoreductase [Clostridium sp.]MBF0012147.1 FAD-dependent oxidoreductase [Enterococcus casseliflavus]MDF2505923.1 dehydrogenase [Clostridium sp.]
MKIIIIGSVAAGTSVAAKARRNTEDAEIVLYDKDMDVSYAVCGIPYAVGGEVENFDELTPRNAEWFKKRYDVDIHTSHEITQVDYDKKLVHGINLITKKSFTNNFDVLVLATGSVYNTPEIFVNRHFENVFQVKNISSGKSIKKFVDENEPKKAVVIGAGYIGLEMAEQLQRLGLEVSLLQRSKYPMSHLDRDMSSRIINEMKRKNIAFFPEETVRKVNGDGSLKSIETAKGTIFSADIFVLATGVKPNTVLAKSMGIKLGITGAIEVNDKLETNFPNVYAVGDVAESFDRITRRPIYRPLASTANKMGRIAGDVITGGNLRHKGILGTGILRFFDLTIAQTGLTEKDALANNIAITTLYNIKPNKPDYMNGKEMVIKAIANKENGKILGAQIIGYDGVDKRIDVLATAISFGAAAEDLFHLDLAYAPPFSTTKDPIHYTGMALNNDINNDTPLMTPIELLRRIDSGEKLQIIDTRSRKQFETSKVEGAIHIPLAELRDRYEELDKECVTVTYCNKGVTGNAAQNILLNKGFKQVYNLSGGNKNYQEVCEMIQKL